MAEAQSSTAIVPVSQDNYSISVKDVSGDGTVQTISVPIAGDSDFNKWNLLLRAVVLKKTTWASQSIPEIIHAIVYADRMGLDIVAGDVYRSPDGRLATTAKAKIRHAMASGKIEGYEVEISEGKAIKLHWETRSASGDYEGPELEAKVSVEVRGFKRPVVYTTTLSEWFKGENPNWRSRPKYMLRMNALSKAMEEVAPMGVDEDEAPPVERASTSNIAEVVKAAVGGK